VGHPRYYGPARPVIMSSSGISRGSTILSEFSIRMPCEDDWPAILNLGNQSLMEVPGAPSQQEWLDNRRSYLPSEGIQRHFVATSGDQIVGYACVEHRGNFKLHPPAINAPHGEYRLVVVVAPSDRSTVGTRLLKLLGRQLIDLGARRAWTLEYEADAHFVSYLERIGFVRQTSFRLPCGTTAVRLIMDAPFQSLAAAEES
jgi:N-acetylglutamate synthase-like GNAT family acetyltransferase